MSAALGSLGSPLRPLSRMRLRIIVAISTVLTGKMWLWVRIIVSILGLEVLSSNILGVSGLSVFASQGPLHRRRCPLHSRLAIFALTSTLATSAPFSTSTLTPVAGASGGWKELARNRASVQFGVETVWVWQKEVNACQMRINELLDVCSRQVGLPLFVSSGPRSRQTERGRLRYPPAPINEFEHQYTEKGIWGNMKYKPQDKVHTCCTLGSLMYSRFSRYSIKIWWAIPFGRQYVIVVGITGKPTTWMAREAPSTSGSVVRATPLAAGTSAAPPARSSQRHEVGSNEWRIVPNSAK